MMFVTLVTFEYAILLAIRFGKGNKIIVKGGAEKMGGKKLNGTWVLYLHMLLKPVCKADYAAVRCATDGGVLTKRRFLLLSVCFDGGRTDPKEPKY